MSGNPQRGRGGQRGGRGGVRGHDSGGGGRGAFRGGSGDNSRGGGSQRGGGGRGASRGGGGGGEFRKGESTRGGGGSYGGGGDRGNYQGRNYQDGGTRGRGDFKSGGTVGFGRGRSTTNPEDDGVHQDGIFPPPSSEVAKIENEFIKKSSTLANAELSSEFPFRPAHGTAGTAITVYTNHFEINVAKEFNLIRYNVDIKELFKKGDDTTVSNKQMAMSKKKKKRLFEIMLENPLYSSAMSDFSSFLISREELGTIGDRSVAVRVAYKKEAEDDAAADASLYEFTIQYCSHLPISVMMDYLKANNSQVNAPMREETLQALNVVINHYAQSQPSTMATGQNRFFPLDGPPNNRYVLGKGLDALRGVFKSVRPATARLLLNVNISYAVCYRAGRLTELVDATGVRNVFAIGKFLKFVQIRRLHLPVKRNASGQRIPGTKTIFDLARADDGSQMGACQPQVARYGAGPKHVKFWLEDPADIVSKTGKKDKKDSKPSGDSVGGRWISVWDFFQAYAANFPLDETRPIINVGNRARPVYLPMEVCEVVPGQPYGRKLESDQTRSMLEFACRRPKANARSITTDARSALGLDSPNDAVLTQNGIAVGKNLLTVPARVLIAPILLYNEEMAPNKKQAVRKITAKNGSWNMGDISFNHGSKVVSYAWTYILSPGGRGAFGRNVDESVSNCGQQISAFVNFIRRQGVAFPPEPVSDTFVPRSFVTGQADETNLHNIFIKASTYGPNKNQKTQFLLFILPRHDTSLYKKIKLMGDVIYGINTICMVDHKFQKERGQEQYFANVALKINLKAGGTNTSMDPAKLGIIGQGQTMIIGFDVTHPQPGAASTAPSVAGMVASIDKHLGQWPAVIKTQQGKKEITSDIEDMFASRLQLWRKKNHTFPKNVIIYRDGVSEGQYQQVIDDEVSALRNVARTIYPADETKKNFPRLTVIVVGKRHHTRFYPTKIQSADFKTFNTQPGTVVDRGVVEVRNWDFYLQAHSSLQGTARPAHYYVIVDEIFKPGMLEKEFPNHKNAADAIEDMTHNMCYLFGRATKAVSICPPAYYADILCERARDYLVKFYEPSTPSEGRTPAASVQGDTDDPVLDSRMCRIHDDLKDSMFYI